MSFLILGSFLILIFTTGGATVRTKSGHALGILMRHVPRVDPVITELITLIETGGEGTAVDALAEVVQNAGTNIGEAAREKISAFVTDSFRSPGTDGKCLSS